MSWAKKEITLTLMPNDFRHASRRGFLGLIGAGFAVGLAAPAWALDTDEARALIQKSLDEVYAVINSGQPPARMYADFEAIFARYFSGRRDGLRPNPENRLIQLRMI